MHQQRWLFANAHSSFPIYKRNSSITQDSGSDNLAKDEGKEMGKDG